MLSFKKIFHILYELRKNHRINDFDINYLSFDKEYLNKILKKIKYEKIFYKNDRFRK